MGNRVGVIGKRLEEIAFRHQNGILWIAYLYSGGSKEESLYTEGWDLREEKGGKLYVTLQKILRNDFCPSRECMFPRFLNCSLAHIDAEMPIELKVVLEGFLASLNIGYHLVKAEPETQKTLNHRWAEALGESDVHEEGALSVLGAGIKAKGR